MRCITLAALVLCAAAPLDGPLAEWPAYGGDAGGSRYSPLTQITKDNVAALRVAWEYHRRQRWAP
jgi:quinoprotein glucose dehydrogenase